MKAAVAFLAAFCAATIPAPAAAPSSDALTTNTAYRHLLTNWAGIRTMSSELRVQTKRRGFPPLSLTLHGRTYFEAPDRQAIVFADVPGLLRPMVADSPTLAPPQAWPRTYAATILDDQGGHTTFRLVPSDAHAKLDHIDAVIGDQSGLIESYAFVNKDGAETTTNNSYQIVSGFPVVTSQTGISRGHGFAADVTTTFSNYEFNRQLPPGTFDR